jgi:hypothetical protein
MRPGSLARLVLEGRSLGSLRGRYHGVSPQAVGYRVRRTLQQFMSRPRPVACPSGDLVLVADGLWFRFRRQPWVLYLMAVKPVQHSRALFLDPVLLPGREEARRWTQAFATIPAAIQPRIRALVSDDLRGILGLVLTRGWIAQLCHFHLISQLQGSRGRRKRRLANRRQREAIYQLTRRALELPDGPALRTTLTRLRRLVRQPLAARRVRMVAREFLRRSEHFRAYRRYPELDLPTTTGTVEAMGHIVRQLMRRLRNVRTPQALSVWATALIRLHPEVTCNGKTLQPIPFV